MGTYISWGAVFAGASIMLVIQLMLSFLGLSIGLWQVEPQRQGAHPFKKIGIGAGVWWFITSLFAVYIGAWVSGRMAGNITSFDAMLHGVLSWTILTLLTTFAVSRGVGHLIGGSLSMLVDGLKSITGAATQTVAKTAGGISSQAQNVDWVGLRSQIENILKESGTQSTAQAGIQGHEDAEHEIEDLAKRFMERGRNLAQDKETMVNILTKTTHMSRTQAEVTADRLVSTFQRSISQVREKVETVKDRAQEVAQEVTEQTVTSLRTAAMASFFMLVCALIVSGWGGANGLLSHYPRM